MVGGLVGGRIRSDDLKKVSVRPYLIFVTGTTGGARGEKNCHVEKFVHITDCQVEKFST